VESVDEVENEDEVETVGDRQQESKDVHSVLEVVTVISLEGFWQVARL